MFHIFKTRLFSSVEKDRILAEIGKAERLTSGEIRVHVESRAGKDSLARAKEVFEQLGMTKTQERNGVLIYLAVKDRKFAIIGDQGIDRVVPGNFWGGDQEPDHALFKEKKFAEGVCLGIALTGEHLATFFPCRSGDVNELTNQISEGN